MTHAPDLTPTSDAGASDPRNDGARRGPVKQIRLLLPVWGEQFIGQFLRVSMPTLLAPGNLPAVAAALPCTLVFLTNTEGAELMRGHPATAYLQSICDVEFDIIDDLITSDNYSTTLTLAYARAIRATGEMMLDTCFFFLISDYIMADGSLANVLARIRAGHSGVLAGNFQVVEEAAKERLFEKFETGEPSISIAPRDLMNWALNYLHPMTLANTVNFPMYCSAHSNRLFWQVDDNTLIGRFYLIHMIAIRPEIVDFQISSSCDYSFVPEMCPSGNVHIVTDSDEYLVVEMQKRSHEGKFIHLGATAQTDLIASLREWTTERHRKNAHSAVVFHAAELPKNLPLVITESEEFIEAIEASLPPPQPFRDHPYWIGAIAAHRRESWKKAQRLKKTGAEADFDDIEAPKATYHDRLYKLRDVFFGRPPRVRPWHPRAPDYAMIEKLAMKYIDAKGEGRTLILSGTAELLEGWLQSSHRTSDSVGIHGLLRSDAENHKKLIGRYDGCLLVMHANELNLLPRLLDVVSSLLSPGNHLLIFVFNGQGVMVGSRFNHEILDTAAAFFDRRMTVDAVQFVMAGRASWVALRGIRNLFVLAMRTPVWLALSAVPMAFLVLISLVGNSVGRKIVTAPAKGLLCSSVGIAMRLKSASLDIPLPKGDDELELAGRRFKNRVPKPAVSIRQAESV